MKKVLNSLFVCVCVTVHGSMRHGHQFNFDQLNQTQMTNLVLVSLLRIYGAPKNLQIVTIPVMVFTLLLLVYVCTYLIVCVPLQCLQYMYGMCKKKVTIYGRTYTRRSTHRYILALTPIRMLVRASIRNPSYIYARTENYISTLKCCSQEHLQLY